MASEIDENHIKVALDTIRRLHHLNFKYYIYEHYLFSGIHFSRFTRKA